MSLEIFKTIDGYEDYEVSSWGRVFNRCTGNFLTPYHHHKGYLRVDLKNGKGRLKLTGVRWAESVRRKQSHGEVTIMDKKIQKFIEKELSDLDFQSTRQGGYGFH